MMTLDDIIFCNLFIFLKFTREMEAMNKNVKLNEIYELIKIKLPKKFNFWCQRIRLLLFDYLNEFFNFLYRNKMKFDTNGF